MFEWNIIARGPLHISRGIKRMQIFVEQSLISPEDEFLDSFVPRTNDSANGRQEYDNERDVIYQPFWASYASAISFD